MKRFIFYFILAAIVALDISAQDNLPRVSVIPFKAIEGVSENEADALTMGFEVALTNSKLSRVVEREEREEIIKFQKDSLDACTDDTCAIEIGKLLSAEEIFSGIVTRFDTGEYMLAIKRIDVTTGLNLASTSITSESLSGVLKEFANIVVSLQTQVEYGGKLLVEETVPENISSEDSQEIALEQKAYVIFNSVPENLKIKLYNGNNNELLYSGTTPTSLRLSLGSYRVEAEKEMFLPFRSEFSVTSGAKLKPVIQLEPDFGRLVINSEPPGADVIFNGVKIGETPYKQDRISSGSHSFIISKELYSPETLDLIIERGETKDVKTILDADYYTLSLKERNNLAGAVYIDGEKYGDLPMIGRLPFRRTNLRVVPKDSRYKTYEAVVLPKVKLERLLETMVFEPRLGSIAVDTSPFVEGDVYIDGKKVGTSPDVFTILVGSHEVSVTTLIDGQVYSGKKTIEIIENRESIVNLPIVLDSEQKVLDEIIAKINDYQKRVALQQQFSTGMVADVEGLIVKLKSFKLEAGAYIFSAEVVLKSMKELQTKWKNTQKIATLETEIAVLEGEIKQLQDYYVVEDILNAGLVGSSVGLTALSVTGVVLGDLAYNKYLAAVTIADAEAYRSEAERWQMVSAYSIGIPLFAAGMYFLTLLLNEESMDSTGSWGQTAEIRKSINIKKRELAALRRMSAE